MTAVQNPRPDFGSVTDGGKLSKTSPDTIRRMIQRGELKAYRIGRQVRIDLNELVDVMAANAGR